MTPRSISVAGFVLVGGHSRRMGRDKALLELDGKPMLLRTAELLQPYAEEVTLLGPAGRYAGFGFPVLPDARPGLGPLGAIYTGLRQSSRDWNLFVACDLPNSTPHIVELLLERASATAAQAIVPFAGNRLQPLCAAYHRSCLPCINAVLERGDNLSLVELLSLLQVEMLTPGPDENSGAWENWFLNVNTRRQWEQRQSSGATKVAWGPLKNK
jgi:molybdopterin-guanine dinucleotide biosynthesis protein A